MPVAFGGTTVLFPPTLTYAVQISFTPPYATPSWVDITRWCRGFKTTTGRQHEMQRIVPGTATVTLDNNDARFNPWNTAGPYALMGAGAVGGIALSPGTPLRIQATWHGTLYNIWYGYVDSWTPAYKNPITGDIDIAATDIMGLLGVADMLSTQYHDRVVADRPAAYYRMNDPSGIVCTDSITGGANNAFYQGTPTLLTSGALLGDPDPAVNLAGQAYISIPAALSPQGQNPFSWEVWLNLNHTAPTQGFAVAAAAVPGTRQQMAIALLPHLLQAYAVDNTGNVWANTGIFTDIGFITDQFTPGWHHIVFAYDGAVAYLYLDGKLGYSTGTAAHANMAAAPQFTVGAFAGSPLAALDAAVDEVALYGYALSAAQVATHYNLGGFAYTVQSSSDRFQAVCQAQGVPPALIDIPQTGNSMVQGATSTLVGTKVGDYLQTVANTEQGAIWQGPDGILHFYSRHYPLTAARAATSQATFEDASNSNYFYRIDNFVPGTDNLDLWNEVSGSAQPGPGTPPVPSGALQVARAPTSINQFAKRSHPPLTGLLTTTDAEVLTLCQWVQQLYSAPQTRVRTIVMDSATNAGGNLPQMLGRIFGDRVTVKYHGGNGGTAFTQDSWIEGVEHDVQADPGSWTTTWRLSPATTVQYLVLDDAVKGKMDGANLLAY